MKRGSTLPLAQAAAATLRGRSHARNEDGFRILDAQHPAVRAAGRGNLYVVADGVSTAPRGREAAEIACARIEGFYDPHGTEAVQSLIALCHEIDWELRERGAGDAACTLSLLWLHHGLATVVHVGDSAVFRGRHGTLRRVTRSNRGRRSLGGFLGMGPGLDEALEIWQEPLFEGDLFVLATDGVTTDVSAGQMLDAWWASGGSPQRCASAILAEVGRRGGDDDATVLVVDVLGLETGA